MTLIRPSDAPLEAGTAGGRYEARLLSEAGGLTQFGAYLLTLDPGARSSDRHWHEAEDELVYILTGTPTLTDNDGPQLLAPGDAVGWRAGVPNGHHLTNQADMPCTFLVVGTRVCRDICHYPDNHSTLTNFDTRWRVTDDATGAILREGEMPAHLRDLPARWGQTDTPAPPSLIRRGTARIQDATPEQAAILGAYSAELLSDTAGLTQFGLAIETLQPGARSSDRHWHESEDEFLLMLTGTATLVEDDGPHPLAQGDACCWPAGTPNGHHVLNRSDQPCSYIILGTRAPADRVHYSDIDKLYTRTADGTVTRTRRDGSPLESA